MKKILLLLLILITSCSTYKEPSQELIQKNNYIEVVGDIKTAEGKEIIGDLERRPMFPNGKKGVSEYIGKNFRFPQDIEKVKGRVVVKFVVSKDGSVSNAEIVESLHPKLDKEAIRVIKSMNKWIPAQKDDKTVAVLYHQPIQF